MSNVTPQIAINKGYTVIAQESVSPNSPAVQLPAHAGTNAILIISKITGQLVYLGDSSVSTNGVPICEEYSYFDGGGVSIGFRNLSIPIIQTNSPEDFYLYAASPGSVVNVLYLSLNT